MKNAKGVEEFGLSHIGYQISLIKETLAAFDEGGMGFILRELKGSTYRMAKKAFIYKREFLCTPFKVKKENLKTPKWLLEMYLRTHPNQISKCFRDASPKTFCLHLNVKFISEL